MPQSLVMILLYSIIAIRYYAAPKEENPSRKELWERRVIGILCAVVMLSCVPWFFAEISESRAKWPVLLHGGTVAVVLLSGTFLARAWHKK